MDTFTQHLSVAHCHTAETMGSGTLPVLATPALIAFMENTAMKLLAGLPEGETSVGTHIDIRHTKASPVGETIACTATLTAQDGRRYTFALTATDSRGDIIGQGTHERFAVETTRFMAKLAR